MNPKLRHCFVHNPLAIAALIFVAARQENKPNRQVRVVDQLAAQLLHFATKERVGQLRQDTRAIASPGIRIQRAAVGKIAECLYGIFQDAMLPLAIGIGHEANAASVVFEFRIVE